MIEPEITGEGLDSALSGVKLKRGVLVTVLQSWFNR